MGDNRNNILSASELITSVIIAAGAGNDTIYGGSGDDLLSGGEGADVIDAGAGNDNVFADAADKVSAGNVVGGEGYDVLNMSEDALLHVADLSDIGFEAVEAGNQADNIAGSADDTNYYLSANGGDDTLITAGGADVLVGGEGDDDLSSGTGSDRVFGGDGADNIDAGDDADFVSGGAGADTLNAGGGNDVYFYQRGDGNDTIHDYAEGEILTRTDSKEEYQYTEQVWKSSGKSGHYVNELRTGYVASTTLVDLY